MKTAARSMILALFALFALTLAACDDDAENVKPRAQEVTGEAIGYYCNMVVAEHMGPKGQIHLKDGSAPLWFSSARDAIAFTMLPEEPKQITAIYVNDMTGANWDSPEPGSWIEARSASASAAPAPKVSQRSVITSAPSTWPTTSRPRTIPSWRRSTSAT